MGLTEQQVREIIRREVKAALKREAVNQTASVVIEYRPKVLGGIGTCGPMNLFSYSPERVIPTI